MNLDSTALLATRVKDKLWDRHGLSLARWSRM